MCFLLQTTLKTQNSIVIGQPAYLLKEQTFTYCDMWKKSSMRSMFPTAGWSCVGVGGSGSNEKLLFTPPDSIITLIYVQNQIWLTNMKSKRKTEHCEINQVSHLHTCCLYLSFSCCNFTIRFLSSSNASKAGTGANPLRYKNIIEQHYLRETDQIAVIYISICLELTLFCSRIPTPSHPPMRHLRVN